MKRKKKQFNIRLRVVFFVLVFIALVLVINLFHIQVQMGDEFRTRADNQYVVASYNSFERGDIYFQGKENETILAAGQKKGYKISVNPSKLSLNDKEKIYQTLHTYRKDIKKDKFFRLLKNKEIIYKEIAHHLDEDEIKKIKSELGKKISIHAEKWRVYPLQRTASHEIGFLGFDNENNFGGRYGLEAFYDKTLKRENKDIYTNFFARAFRNARELMDSDIQREGDIVSSIDIMSQLFLEKNLQKIQEKWHSQLTGGIIMDPHTGEIIAMASLPNFDNNHFSKEPISVFKNPLVSNVYEFGSVMKPLVVAVGLDTKVITANSKYFDKGSVKIGKYTINNYDKRGRGWVTVQEILNQSLNTGMTFIAKKIPKDSFREYFQNYGFGKKSGIDLPQDASGLTSNLESHNYIEFANISFGQGIAVSPISFIKAASALANGGVTVTPHLVKRINYTNGLHKDLVFPDGQRVLSPETSRKISKMMVEVFDKYRKGTVKLPHHSIAAKTGTAQIPAPGGGYYGDRHLHSFIAYFPAEQPRFIVFLYTVYPKGVRYSSQTLLDPFRSLAQYLISYYHIPPDR